MRTIVDAHHHPTGQAVEPAMYMVYTPSVHARYTPVLCVDARPPEDRRMRLQGRAARLVPRRHTLLAVQLHCMCGAVCDVMDLHRWRLAGAHRAGHGHYACCTECTCSISNAAACNHYTWRRRGTQGKGRWCGCFDYLRFIEHIDRHALFNTLFASTK